MGTYWHYVCDQEKEYISLSDLRDGGDKENAVIYCGEILAYIMGPRGRWAGELVKIQADYERCTPDLDDAGYQNISALVLYQFREYESMYPGIVSRFRKPEDSPRWEQDGYGDPRVVP